MTTRRRFLVTGAGLSLTPVLGDLGAAMGRGRAEGPSGGIDEGAPAAWTKPRQAGETLLAWVGDIFLRRPFEDPVAEGTLRLLEALADCDVAVGNLENGLSTVGSPALGGMRFGPSLRGPPELVSELGFYHLGAVSLANNHTGNFGPQALLETMAVLDGAGVAHAGAGAGTEDALRPALVRAGPLMVGIISVYSFYYGFEADDVARPDRPGISACRAYDVVLATEPILEFARMQPDSRPAWLVPHASAPSRVVLGISRSDLDALSHTVRAARADADFLVVSFHIHWGRHYRSDLPVHQRALARAMVDAGADLVVAHGPHVLRGVELYGGRAIAYSLANFVLTPVPAGERATREVWGDPARESVVLRLRLKDQAAHLELLPILIGLDGRPRLETGALGQEILERMRALSAVLGTEVQVGRGLGTVSIPSGAAPR